MSGKQQRALAVLNDVRKNNCEADWGYLDNKGHHYKTVAACVSNGLLDQLSPYHYRLTGLGTMSIMLGYALKGPIPNGEAPKA